LLASSLSCFSPFMTCDTGDAICNIQQKAGKERSWKNMGNSKGILENHIITLLQMLCFVQIGWQHSYLPLCKISTSINVQYLKDKTSSIHNITNTQNVLNTISWYIHNPSLYQTLHD
jgi:hypothetical protein